MWLLVVLVLSVGVLIYKYIIEPFSYWKKRNVATQKTWTLVRHTLDLLLKKKSFVDNVAAFYQDFPNERYIGTHQINNPVLIVRDLELIKKIAIKDFDYFPDHKTIVNDKADPIFARNLISLSGQRWRDMRAHLSPAFTSSKMKAMFHLMSECSKEFVDHFLKKDEKVVELEMKEVFSRFTNDVIASTAFGVTCNSLSDENNEFFVMGRDITDVSAMRVIKILLYAAFPTLTRIFRVKLFPKAGVFFEQLVSDTIKLREKEHIIRPDMIHLLMEAKKGKLKYEEDSSSVTEIGFATVEESKIGQVEKEQKQKLTDLDIAAQALLFFFAGFDTSSGVMSFMAHELAVHVDIQERLQQEIDDVLQNDGEVTYEAILKMKYLDMVISECLRKWSPAILVERLCVKDYTILPENEDEKPLIIEKGVSVNIPIRGIHYDPQFFPNPEKFDPERFNDDNKGNVVPYSYMPFGIGPRNCIASRFALLEIKTMFFHLLSKFNIVVVEKTCIPLKLATKKLKMEPENGFWLGLSKR